MGGRNFENTYMSRMYEVATDIDAPASKVWRILSDLESWKDWNRLNPGAAGTPVVGQTLTLNTLAAPGKIRAARAKVIEYKPEQTIRWTGGLPVPGLYRIEHWFRVESLGEFRCRLIHGEVHRGLLVGLFLKPFGINFEGYYKDTNTALKVLVEEGAPR